MTETSAPRVVLAGGGVAALETLVALRDLAGERVQITLIAPDDAFTYRPMTVAEPFAKGHARAYPLRGIAEQLDAGFVQRAVTGVDAAAREVRTAEGDPVPYDHLVLATGARATPAYAHGITFGEDREEEALHGLLQDAEEGYLKRVAFVVPADTSWTLPLYELALMTARQVWSLGADWLKLIVVTPEERPLGLFGAGASETVAGLLAAAGIEFAGSAYAQVERDHLVLDPGGRRLDVDRVVSLPRLEARRLEGVPADPDGFIPVDAHGRVTGLENVYAAGDGIAFPIKQGGLATQQADAVAEALAAAVGAPVEPKPFHPVLRGILLTGGDDRFMRAGVAGGDGEPDVAAYPLWWPPTKIAGRYLAPFLMGRDELEAARRAGADHLAVEADLSQAAASGP